MGLDRVTGAALAAQSVSFGLNFSAGVFFAPVSAAYGFGAATTAVAAGLATAVTGPAQPVVGRLLDRYGPRAVLLAGLTLISSGYVALALVRDAWQFVAAYTLLGGLGFAASSSLAVTTLIGRHHGDRAGPALTRASVGINLGQLLAPWAATALLEPAGVRGTYLALGLTGLLATAVLAAALPADPPIAPAGTPPATIEPNRDRPPHAPAETDARPPGRAASEPGPSESQRPPNGRATRVAFAAPSPVLTRSGRRGPDGPGEAGLRGKGRLLISFGLHSATLYALVLLLPRYATDLGWSAVAAGRLVAVSAVAAGIAAVVVARLLRRYEPESLLRALHLIRAVALVLAAVATDGRVLVAVAVVFGIASFTVIPLTMTLLTRGLDRARLGRALAPAWLIHQVSAGAALAVAVAVHACSGSYRGFFALGVLLSLIAAARVPLAQRKEPHDEHPSPYRRGAGSPGLLPGGGRPREPRPGAPARLSDQLGHVPQPDAGSGG